MKQSSFKTSKGTELPLLDLRGKPYLQVAHRLVWFREDKPDWTIKTQINPDFEKSRCIGSCEILDGSGRLIATGHKVETASGFADYIEKSETGAVGRALAMCGYGTQFAPEMDEEDRIVDAPVTPAKQFTPPSVSDEIIKIMGRLKNELGIAQQAIGPWMKEKSGMASIDWTMHTVADVNAIIDQEKRGK